MLRYRPNQISTLFRTLSVLQQSFDDSLLEVLASVPPTVRNFDQTLKNGLDG